MRGASQVLKEYGREKGFFFQWVIRKDCCGWYYNGLRGSWVVGVQIEFANKGKWSSWLTVTTNTNVLFRDSKARWKGWGRQGDKVCVAHTYYLRQQWQVSLEMPVTRPYRFMLGDGHVPQKKAKKTQRQQRQMDATTWEENRMVPPRGIDMVPH